MCGSLRLHNNPLAHARWGLMKRKVEELNTIIMKKSQECSGFGESGVPAGVSRNVSHNSVTPVYWDTKGTDTEDTALASAVFT